MAKLTAPQTPISKADAEDKARTQTLSALGHGAQAGATYGTLARGTLYGDEIRPALPVRTADPSVWPWQLPESPGNEVIEITIDERGEIINKVVLHSLGPDIDSGAWPPSKIGTSSQQPATAHQFHPSKMPYFRSAPAGKAL